MGRSGALVLGLVVGLAGCTHALHMNRTSDFEVTQPLTGYRVIESSAQQSVILYFVGNTDYADRAFEGLIKKCPRGQVTGIQTRYSTSHGFLSWTNHIKMEGYCSDAETHVGRVTQ